jgi:integrase
LWLSGLRLGKALLLDWVDDRKLCVDFSGKRPMFLFQPDGQKSNKAQLLPMAPEFAEFLSQTPEVDREGFVFTPQSQRPHIARMWLDSVSKINTRIGKAAGVKVAESRKGKVKYASAHDFRRSFGFRWSNLVIPAILQQLMRHSSITTTMEYYVGRNAEAAADALWEAIESNRESTTPSGTEVASLK